MTAQDLLNIENKTIGGISVFEVNSLNAIAECMRNDETALYLVTSKTIFRGNSSTLFCGAIVVTNKRLVYGGQMMRLFKASYTASSIDAKMITSVNVGYVGPGAATVTVETTAHDDLSFNVDVNQANAISQTIMNLVDEIKNNSQTQVVVQNSAADELKKFKELLDSGVISQEEFDAKKKQLLGL